MSDRDHARRRDAGATKAVFVGCLAAWLLLARSHPLVGDEAQIQAMAEGLLDLLMAPDRWGLDGLREALGKQGPGAALLQIPFVLAGRLLGAVTGSEAARALLVHAAYPTFAAAGAALFFAFARELGASARRALALTSLLAFGTFWSVHARVGFAELPQAVLLLWATRSAARARLGQPGALTRLGVAGGLALATKVTSAVALPPLLLLATVGRRPEPAAWARCAALLALGAGILLLQNLALTGSPFSSGYATDLDATWGFSTDPLTGLWGQLLSPGRGLLLYAPPLLALPWAARAAWRADRGLVGAIGTVVVGLLLLHAAWWSWHGGWGWGPRFLLPAVPLLMLIFALGDRPRLGAWPWALAMAACAALQLPGLLIHHDQYMRLLQQETDVLPPRAMPTFPLQDDFVHVQFVPVFSPLVGHAWMARHAAWTPTEALDEAMARDCPWCTLNAAWAPARPSLWTRLNLWFVAARLPGPLAAAWLLACLGALAWSARALRRVAS